MEYCEKAEVSEIEKVKREIEDKTSIEAKSVRRILDVSLRQVYNN